MDYSGSLCRGRHAPELGAVLACIIAGFPPQIQRSIVQGCLVSNSECTGIPLSRTVGFFRFNFEFLLKPIT